MDERFTNNEIGLGRCSIDGRRSIADLVTPYASGQLIPVLEDHPARAAGVSESEIGPLQRAPKSQWATADLAPLCSGGLHDADNVQQENVSAANPIGDGAQADVASFGHHASDAVSDTVAEIRMQWRQRQAWHRAEKSLTLQAKALCRRLVDGDKSEAEKLFKAALGNGSHDLSAVAFGAIFPLTVAKESIEKQRKLVEKRLSKLAKLLPVAPFVEGTRGVGILSLAAIVGETGDLANYSTHSKLWKRLGLAVMPDGTRQRKVAGDAAIAHGYNPTRRSMVWNIGACIIKAGGPLKEIYDARKVYEMERVETKGHAHHRAQRYVEKKFVRALWREWNRGTMGAEQ